MTRIKRQNRPKCQIELVNIKQWNVCMKKRMMLILSCLLLSIGYSVAQTTRATGVVIDDLGDPAIGVSVVVKGTTTGVTTDIDGKFSINVPEGNPTLVFSLIGMKTVEMRASTNMRVVMKEDERVLNEVVVTALGISRDKKALGYSAQSVNTDKLLQASNNDLAGALQGKLAGVQITPSSGMPGSSSQFVIRGARSFTGNNTPLYVIDGMPVSSTSDVNTDTQNNGSVSGTDFANRAVDIDPSDIASIEILKGQAASALYGIRASNGVIVITTKSGKGLAKGKPHVTVGSNISFEKLSRYPELQTKYAQGTGGAYIYNQSKSWGPLISELPNDPAYGGNTSNVNTNFGANLRPGQYFVPQRANGGVDPWATPGVYDNVREFFNTGVTWNNSLNLAQALDNTTYSISLSSATQDGVVPNTGMDRYVAKVGAETKLTSQFTSGFVGTYVNTSIKKAPGANDGIVATVFNAPSSYDLAGIPSHYEGNPFQQNNYRAGSAFVNPYWFVENNKFTEKTSRFYGNIYTNFASKLNSTDKKLNVKYQIGTDAYNTNYMDSWGYGNKGSANNGQMETYKWSVVNFNSLLTASLDWTINSDWSLNTLIGNEIVHESKENTYQFGQNFTFPGWNNIGNATLRTAMTKDTYSRRTVGFFGNASISYKNMLYVDVTGRNDIVSFMPRNNRSFFYPSVSTSFILSELEGFKNDIVEFAKVRLAYAEVGQAADDYQANFFSTPTFGGGFYTFTPIGYPINGINAFTPHYKVYDPDLKPQNTRSYEAGFDTRLLNGLLDISYSFSRQNVTDQIFEVPLAGSTGIQSIVTNAGRIHTNVHEATININPIRTKDFDWLIGLNWAKIDNFVDELAPGVESISLGGFVTPQVRASAGNRFPVIFGSDFKRDSQGRILVDANGMPMNGEDAVIGDVSPNFNLGFNTNIRIKKVNLAAVFDWKSGGQMYHGSNGLLDFYGMSKKTENRNQSMVFDAWKEDGTKNDIAITPDKMEKFYSVLNGIDAASVYDNSFIKIRELSVSYNIFKSSWCDVVISGFARNILVWTELPNFDPEASQGNNNMAGAFERFSLPQTSSYGFGAIVKF